MPRVSFLIVTFCMFFGCTALASAQQIHLPPAVSQSQSMGNVPTSGSPDIQKQQALAANQQRQVEIRRDTEKLAELTQELKEDLLKSDHGVISVDTLKRAEQIEKLAHSVKSKMKQSF
jgi:TolA-binding protein